MKYVLDACSLIAYFNDEEGSLTVKSILAEAVSGDTTVLIHRVNLFEVYYDLLRSGGEIMARTAMAFLYDSPVEIINIITDEIMEEAARFKLSYKISVADSFALAISKLEGATLITADHHEFNAIDEANELPILWFR